MDVKFQFTEIEEFLAVVLKLKLGDNSSLYDSLLKIFAFLGPSSNIPKKKSKKGLSGKTTGNMHILSSWNNGHKGFEQKS